MPLNYEQRTRNLVYLLVLVNKSGRQDNTLTKCKRVTRSVLALEIYSIVSGVNIAIAILTTLKIITERLGLPSIPLVICTDLYSLYKCLVKLGTTNEKRLIINIMALRQSYERHNPADALTKATPNRALKQFINSNMLLIRVEGSVQRPTE
ncbi:hypothetical protein BU23DRAFT_576404 [Bimuria novae-zelandiae CBS 107.79]|uniref:Reverse transcriptase Ty1/copia-type domain-containing protein n=1 Tax=Bimuria novae-zelandiae CBS 107.79 TaxID=1447943 RepID=A0A6A5VV76_9PLEO|nr:hypothetical protein BU23DRAFT_576404 [Bimuria novae-zelandiae CBS 107.79]